MIIEIQRLKQQLKEERGRANHLAKYCKERLDYGRMQNYEGQSAALTLCIQKLDLLLNSENEKQR